MTLNPLQWKKSRQRAAKQKLYSVHVNRFCTVISDFLGPGWRPCVFLGKHVWCVPSLISEPWTSRLRFCCNEACVNVTALWPARSQNTMSDFVMNPAGLLLTPWVGFCSNLPPDIASLPGNLQGFLHCAGLCSICQLSWKAWMFQTTGGIVCLFVSLLVLEQWDLKQWNWLGLVLFQ